MNFKRFAAGLLAAGMSLSAIGASALAPDLENAGIDTEAGLLGALGIMVGDDEGNFRPDDSIKRSEFAKIAVTTLGMEKSAASYANVQVFDDVPTWHWANGYIAIAAQRGIFIGDGDGTYRPDDNVSYAEAMTVFTRILGYDKAAEEKGQWPNGHIAMGTQIGLSKNIGAAAAGSAITRKNSAKMNYNALTINMMEQTGFGNNISYEITDKTILADTLKVTKISGQVTANSNTSLDGKGSVRENEIKIGNTVYKTSVSDTDSLLGYNVTGYLRSDELADINEIIYLLADKNTKELSVYSDNIASVSESGSKIVLKYRTSGSDTTKAVNIATDSKLIYNGKSAEFDISLIKPQNGKIVLLDSNYDSTYDVVIVTSYVNYVVDEISRSTYTISDKYGNKPLKLDPDNDDIKYEITDKYGNEVKFSDIEEWNVLSLTKSLDEKLIKIGVCFESVSGKVTAIGEDSIEIDDKEYTVSPSYTGEISVGLEGVFYLDVENRIAAINSDAASSGNYAYFVAAGKNSGLSSPVQVKLIDKNGDILTLTADTKVIFNSSRVDAAEIVSKLTSMQPVTYSTNAGGKITKISTAEDNTASGKFSNEFSKDFVGEKVSYSENSSKLGKYTITEDTIVFDIPAGETEAENFAVRDITMFADDGKYSVEIYDVNEDFSVSVVVVTDYEQSAYADANIAIINKLSNVQNSNGEIVQSATVYVGGEIKTLTASKPDVFMKDSGKLETGDIIHYSSNSRGEVDKISLILDIDNKSDEFFTENEKTTFVNGRVEKKFTSSVNVSVNGGSVENYSLKDVTVYKYDPAKNNKISVASTADIEKYSESNPQTLFIRIFDGKVKEMVIIG